MNRFQDEIKALAERFANAMVAKNFEEMMDCYDEEVVYQMPGVPTIIGRSGIEEHYRQVLAMNPTSTVMTTDSYVEIGDSVVEAGSYTLTLEPPGTEPIRDFGKYQIVYRKTGGKWRFWFDCVHSDASATVGDLHG